MVPDDEVVEKAAEPIEEEPKKVEAKAEAKDEAEAETKPPSKGKSKNKDDAKPVMEGKDKKGDEAADKPEAAVDSPTPPPEGAAKVETTPTPPAAKASAAGGSHVRKLPEARTPRQPQRGGGRGGGDRRHSGGSRGGFRPQRGDRDSVWEPKTRLGLMVKNGEITTMGDALATGYPLREAEIIDILLPEIDDEVLDVNMVQRMTDSGRRVRFAITTVVGNGDGYVGIGKATGKEVGPAIRKAIDNAKLNIIEVKRGCGSWECGCGTPHSLPFSVKGKSGSVEVTFKPAPRGISLAVGDVAKHILRLAGIKDSWGFTSGKTRTTVNYAKAAFDALGKLSEMRILPNQEDRLHIHTGSIGFSTLEKGGDDE